MSGLLGRYVPVLFKRKIRYLMRDEFTDVRGAGAVDTTPCVPGPGVRNVTDTENKVTVNGASLLFAGGKAVPDYGDPGFWGSARTRAAGRMLHLSLSNTGGSVQTGWDINTNGTLDGNGIAVVGTFTIYEGGWGPMVSLLALATTYKMAFVLRSTGCFYFVKGGAFANWTLLWISTTNNTATLYPTVTNFDSNSTIGYMRVPEQLWLPVPFVSDSFNRADGVMGNTDGAGHAEANGGAGQAWVSSAGTWGINTNKAACSALDAGKGVCTIATTSTNFIAGVDATRAGGEVGGVLRYTDADNFIYFVHDGANAKLVERIGGAENTVITAAAAYVAGARLVASLDGAAARLYYNGALVGSNNTALVAGTGVGLYTTNVGNRIDNAVFWPRGNEGQYGALDRWSAA